MKTIIYVVVGFVVSLMLAGCGGGDVPPSLTSTSSGGRGSATFTVKWPQRSRLIPNASNSIQVVINQGVVVLAKQLMQRPSGSGVATVSFNLLPTGTLSTAATAFPNLDGSGTAQATATISLNIQPNLNTAIALTMNSTIDHLSLSPGAPTVTVESTAPMTVTAVDTAGDIVLTSAFHWTTADSTIATVDQGGNISGVNAGNTQITVTETESGKAANVTVTVSSPIISAPFLYDGFAYTAGGPVSGQNGGTGAWGGAWNEYGQGYTSSVISASGLTYGSLVTTGNAIMTTSDFPIGHARRFQTSPGKTGGVLFISCLIKPLDAMNAGYPNTYFGLFYGGVSAGKGGGSAYYGLENSGGGGRVDLNVLAVTGQTVFLVLRITFGPASGNDTIDLFVNPTPGQPIPAVPDATKSDANTGTPADFNFGGSIRCMFDEVRFGHTFADVAPSS